MDRERVIVYIDEETDDGMMWEELNQNGQMQVSVYDEEYEYDVEYHHSVRVKSLQEYLADYTKQVRKEVIEQVKDYMESHSHTNFINTKNRKVVYKIGLTRFLDQIQGV